MLLVFFGLSGISFAREGTITYEPGDGAGQGKHIVFVCGEWEYRCEESLPMLAKILSKRHGFKCTVLFSINPEDGTVEPSVKNNIPGMSVLESADMMVVFAMDLELPDEQMKYFARFLETGKPVFGIRCSLLSFRYNKNKNSLYAHFDFRNKDGGYATSLFGESWKGHYGSHGKESTRGLRAGMNEKHPILRGVHDVWGPTDVYRITKLPPDAEVLMYGQVLTGMNPDDPPNLQKSIMPMVWTRRIKRDSGQVSRVVMSTIGAAQDMESEDLRRLYVNSIFWAVGLESGIPEKADVSYVGEDWKASPFGGGKFKKGLKPEDFAVKAEIVQAGFFTPARAGKIWDTWIYYHDGKYYMYYLAGSGGHWDGHELATSEDGVHWKEQGVMIKPRAGVTWMGTGHIWKSPDFAKTHQWVMNYSEWFGDKPQGPFLGQKKNHNVFGKGCNIYFPRFFHNAPGGPLVNHFYTGGTVFAAPLKAIEIDREGVLRLKWWKNNNRLKAKPVKTRLVAAGAAYPSSPRMLDKKLDLSRTNVIEGTVGELPLRAPDGGKYGIFFDHGNGQGQCLLLARDAVQFGEIKADGGNLKIQQTSSRDMEFGPTVTFRLVIKLDMMELYINDYLMNLKRVKCNGQVGFMGADDEGAFKNIKVWQSN